MTGCGRGRRHLPRDHSQLRSRTFRRVVQVDRDQPPRTVAGLGRPDAS